SKAQLKYKQAVFEELIGRVRLSKQKSDLFVLTQYEKALADNDRKNIEKYAQIILFEHTDILKQIYIEIINGLDSHDTRKKFMLETNDPNNPGVIDVLLQAKKRNPYQFLYIKSSQSARANLETLLEKVKQSKRDSL